MSTHDTQVTMRLPTDLVKRADALIGKLRKVPELKTWGRVSRAAVLRLAILHGLEALEKEYGGKR